MLGRLAPPAGNGHSYDVQRLHKSGCQGEEVIQKCNMMRDYNWYIRGVNISASQTFYKLKNGMWGKSHSWGWSSIRFQSYDHYDHRENGLHAERMYRAAISLVLRSVCTLGRCSRGGCKDIQYVLLHIFKHVDG